MVVKISNDVVSSVLGYFPSQTDFMKNLLAYVNDPANHKHVPARIAAQGCTTWISKSVVAKIWGSMSLAAPVDVSRCHHYVWYMLDGFMCGQYAGPGRLYINPEILSRCISIMEYVDSLDLMDLPKEPVFSEQLTYSPVFMVFNVINHYVNGLEMYLENIETFIRKRFGQTSEEYYTISHYIDRIFPSERVSRSIDPVDVINCTDITPEFFIPFCA